MFQFFVLLYTAIVLLIYLYKVRYDVFKDRLPFIPFSIKLFHKWYGTHPTAQIQNAYDTLKSKAPVGGIFIGVSPILLITDLKLAQRILIKDFDTFVNRGIYYNPKDDPVGSSMFVIEDDKWRNFRHKISPTFSSGKIKAMVPGMLIKSNELNEVLMEASQDPNWDMKNILARFAADVIALIAFGLECNGMRDPNNEFVSFGMTVFKQINELAPSVMLKSEFPSVARFLRRRRLTKELTDFYYKVTTKTIGFRKEANVNLDDFIGLMLPLLESTGDDKLTLDEVVASSFSFFAAGFETSSNTLNYALYNLATHEELQETTRNEILEVLKAHGEITYDALLEMKTLDKVLQGGFGIYF